MNKIILSEEEVSESIVEISRKNKTHSNDLVIDKIFNINCFKRVKIKNYLIL